MIPDAAAAWNDGLPAQLSFWVGVIRSYDGFEAFHAEMKQRLDPERPIDADAAPFLPDKPKLRILDVGSGPVASVGWRAPGREVEVTAIDVLALLFNANMETSGLASPSPTVQCDPEKMDVFFYMDRFDLVYFNRAITQCYDPPLALTAASGVLQEGGRIYVAGSALDGEESEYYATHQWNLRIIDRATIEFWRPDDRVSFDPASVGLKLTHLVESGSYCRFLLERS